MHMSFSSNKQSILEGNGSFLVKKLLERLGPDKWPFTFNDLPEGTLLVGGAVRDGLLKHNNTLPELDFVVPNQATKVCKNLVQKYGGTLVQLDKERDIARYVINDWKIDVASCIGSCFEEDLMRRDFTLNAIGLNLGSNPFLIDPSGGLNDLRNKKLVAINEQNLIDDPLRILRGFRLISEHKLILEKRTQCFFRDNVKLLKSVASERIKSEIERLVSSPWFDEVNPLLRKIAVLEAWAENVHFEQIGSLSLKNVSSFSTDELKIDLPLARLMLLISQEGLIHLGFSKRTIKTCNYLRYWLQKDDGSGFKNLTEDERFQLHVELETHLPALILMISGIDKKVWLDRWRDSSDPLFHPASPINGNTLKELFTAPEGRWVGELINILSKERAFGRLQNQQEAFEFTRYWWKHNNPFCD